MRYINVPIDVLKKAAAESIKSKEVQDGGYNAEVYNDVCTVYSVDFCSKQASDLSFQTC